MNSTMSALKSAIGRLLNYLNKIVDKMNAFWNMLVGEIIKLLQIFTGNGTGMLFSLQSKLEILQLVAMIKGLIQALTHPKPCNDKGNEIDILLNLIPISPGFTISKNLDGSYRILENSDPVTNVLQNSQNSQQNSPNTSQISNRW